MESTSTPIAKIFMRSLVFFLGYHANIHIVRASEVVQFPDRCVAQGTVCGIQFERESRQAPLIFQQVQVHGSVGAVAILRPSLKKKKADLSLVSGQFIIVQPKSGDSQKGFYIEAKGSIVELSFDQQVLIDVVGSEVQFTSIQGDLKLTAVGNALPLILTQGQAIKVYGLSESGNAVTGSMYPPALPGLIRKYEATYIATQESPVEQAVAVVQAAVLQSVQNFEKQAKDYVNENRAASERKLRAIASAREQEALENARLRQLFRDQYGK